MLKEKTVYKDELPVNVVVANIKEYPIHFHDDIEIVYVLDGSINFKNGHYEYLLKAGDVFILNDREIHSLSSTGEYNIVMMLQMDLTYFARYYDNLKNSFFVTDMDDDSDESLEVLRTLLAKIMMEILQKGYGYERKVIETTHNLIACLISDFQYFIMEDGKFANEAKNKGNKILTGRLNRITDYMYENYNRKLTLNEIAEKEHLSIYYLSHVIKESTGLSFQDLLSYIRVEESEKLLLGSNKKIGAIAEETGFSAVRYYIKHFETWFGMHPLEYRKKYAGKVSGREIIAEYKRSTPHDIEEAIKKQVKGIYSDYIRSNAPKPSIIDVDIYNPQMGIVNKSALGLEEFLKSDNLKFIARPYNLIKSLRENIVAAGDNYIITTASKYPDEIRSISILVYNFNEKLKEALTSSKNRAEDLQAILNYNENVEFLIRCLGISGDFKISRYTLTRENIIVAYEEPEDGEITHTKRQNLLNNWRTLPVVEFGEHTVSDTLSLSVNLSGLSAELILIDKK